MWRQPVVLCGFGNLGKIGKEFPEDHSKNEQPHWAIPAQCGEKPLAPRGVLPGGMATQFLLFIIES
jgi:hypothetical protein